MTLTDHRRLIIIVFVSVFIIVTMLFQLTARGRYATSTSVQKTDPKEDTTQLTSNYPEEKLQRKNKSQINRPTRDDDDRTTTSPQTLNTKKRQRKVGSQVNRPTKDNDARMMSPQNIPVANCSRKPVSARNLERRDSIEYISARNLERRNRLADQCARLTSRKNVRRISDNASRENVDVVIRAKDYGSIFFNDDLKVVYCPVPKVANTNWKRVLLMLNGKVNVSRLEDMDNFVAYHSQFHSSTRTLSELKPDEIRWRLKTYFKFLFVRHPLERIVSAYENKFAGDASHDAYYHLKYGRKIIRLYRSKPSKESLERGHDVTFPEFVRYLGYDENIYPFYWNRHWKPYSIICRPCQVNYDFIGKYETLHEDAAHVINIIAKKSSSALSGTLVNKIGFPSGQRHSNRTADVLSQFAGVPFKHFRRFKELYNEDLSLFSYDYQLRKDGNLASYRSDSSSF